GRKAGTVANFDYSDANKNSGIVWNEATFEDYIKNPASKVPDTKMAFPGIKNEQQAKDLWAYLTQFDAEGNIKNNPERATVHLGIDDERTPDLRTTKRLHEMAGAAPADRKPGPFVVRRLSDAAQSELLVDLRGDSHLHARGADRYRHRPGDALCPTR